MNGSGSHLRSLAVLAAVAACAAWGVSFLAPRALVSVDSATIALFRFLFFGASSLVALGFARARADRPMPKLSGRDAVRALVLGSAGYSVYYFLLAFGVKGAGISFSVGVIGLLPLTTLAASTPPRRWAALSLPILLLLSGAAMIAWDLSRVDDSFRSPADRLRGAIACVAALALWTYFAVANAGFLRSRPDWRALDWAGVLGVASALVSMALFLVVEGGFAVDRLLEGFRDSNFLLWTGFMGIAGAWGATALWNFASRHLQGAWLGQLLVFESIFGLGFGFLYDGRGPRLWEGAALVTLLSGVVVGLVILNRQEK